MMYAEYLFYSFDECTYLTSYSDGMIHLCDLISHRKIRIKVTLTIEFTHFLNLTSKCMARADSKVNNSC